MKLNNNTNNDVYRDARTHCRKLRRERPIVFINVGILWMNAERMLLWAESLDGDGEEEAMKEEKSEYAGSEAKWMSISYVYTKTTEW